MGKLEKVIVLSVLFLIAAILVVSLTVDDPLDKPSVAYAGTTIDKAAEPGPASIPTGDRKSEPAVSAPTAGTGAGTQPSTSAPVEVAAAGPTSAPSAAPATAQAAIDAKPTGAAPTTLLNASVTPGAAAAPARSLLVTDAGLHDSFMPDMRFYTWQAGDTFRSVAAKYYGDAARMTLLRRANEGRYDVTPGEKILVPIVDLDAPAPAGAGAGITVAAGAKGSSQPPETTGQGAPASAAAAAPAAPIKPAGATETGARIHVVREGESLWKIAKQELGSGARWNEIYEANRDVLSSPEALHTGLKLRIP